MNKIDENGKNALTELVKEVYDDGLHKSVSKVGDVLAETIDKLLDPLKFVLWGYDNMKKWLIDKVKPNLSNTKEEDLIAPDPLVAGPLITNMVYSNNHKEIQDMYAKLLAKAMDKNYEKDILPSFVEIVKQLSPLDVLVLNYYMQDNADKRVIEIRAFYNKEPEELSSFTTLFKNYILTKFDNASEKDVAISLNNLQRLNLLSIPNGLFLSKSYNDFKDSNFYKSFFMDPSVLFHGGTLEIEKEKIEFTDFGLLFMSIVSY